MYSLARAHEKKLAVAAMVREEDLEDLKTLRDDLQVSIIYITHDLATAYYISDRVIIMRKGEVVESGDARSVLDAPSHPYSIALKNAVLPPDPARARTCRLSRRARWYRNARSGR